MQRSWRLRSKLNAIVCAMSVGAAASAKEGEARETNFGGQILHNYEKVEQHIQHQKLMELTERATSAEKDNLRDQIAGVEAEKRAPAESKGIADRPVYLNYEVPARKLAQYKPATPSKPAPGRTTPLLDTHPISPQGEKYFSTDKKPPLLDLRPGEFSPGKSPERAAAEKAAAEKAAAEKAAAEKAAAERALKAVNDAFIREGQIMTRWPSRPLAPPQQLLKRKMFVREP